MSYGTIPDSGGLLFLLFRCCSNLALPDNLCGSEGYCSLTLPEGEGVFVTIAGQTFQAGYNGGTAQQLISQLTQEINNAESPVTATVSGTTIYLQSVIKGSAMNYPLAVAFGWGPNCANTGGAMPCFSNPSFTAIASGSQLTGGTD